MKMRLPFVGAIALALAACATAPAADTPQGVTASVPADPLPVVGAEVLFWDDATRSARFRSMETYFPGQEVAPPQDTRPLPEGEPLFLRAGLFLLLPHLPEQGQHLLFILVPCTDLLNRRECLLKDQMDFSTRLLEGSKS